MIGGFEDRRKEKVGHDPKRIAELVASIRKRVAQDPGVLRLEQNYTEWGLSFAAERLVWSPYGLSPTDFTEEEAQEALKLLLEEEQGTRKVVSEPAETR